MGKHDKQETNFTWQPMPDDFYKARIKSLESENLKLHEKIAEYEKAAGINELAMDHQDEVHNGIVAEFEELLDEKDEEIAVLKGQIKMLKEAVVKGALREVLA